MTPKNNTTLAPAPESLAAALASAGLDVQLAVSRKDGAPLSDNDLAAVRAMVACADIEAGREVSDDEAAHVATIATAGEPEHVRPVGAFVHN
jgi:hypothetical protein